MAHSLFSPAVALCIFSFTESLLVRKHLEHLSLKDVFNLQKAHGDVNNDTATIVRDQSKNNRYGQEHREAVTAAPRVRRNLESLSKDEVESLRAAFLSIQEDHKYENITDFYGKPGMCENNGQKVLCGVYGTPRFLPWNRLYLQQVEEALLDHGSSVALPYKVIGEDAVTIRDPQLELFSNDDLYQQGSLALEQTSFCDFAIQLEILNNALLFLLSEDDQHSISSRDYAVFDPVFFLHHSNIDRIWAIWQELQRYRRLPYNETDINFMMEPLHPFDDPEINHNQRTRRYSSPADTFDYRNHFLYEYDSLKLTNYDLDQLDRMLKERSAQDRNFAGFILHAFENPVQVNLFICMSHDNCSRSVGDFYILGATSELPWEYDCLYKYDITHQLEDLGVRHNDTFFIRYEIHDRAGNDLGQPFPAPIVLHEVETNE